MQSTELVGIPQLAAALGVDQSTVNRRISAGKLTPAGYVGKRALFTAEDVERLKRGEQQFPQELTR